MTLDCRQSFFELGDSADEAQFRDLWSRLAQLKGTNMVETPTLVDETGALALCAVYTKGAGGNNGIRAVSCLADLRRK
jgi:hypothetical protein